MTEHLPSEPDDDAEIVGYLQQGEQLLAKQQIAKIPTALSVDFENDLSLVNSGLEALKESTNTDIAMLNTGLFLNGLDEGIVNRNQLHEMLPHAMHVMKVTLLGSDLIRLVREIEKNRNFF